MTLLRFFPEPEVLRGCWLSEASSDSGVEAVDSRISSLDIVYVFGVDDLELIGLESCGDGYAAESKVISTKYDQSISAPG